MAVTKIKTASAVTTSPTPFDLRFPSSGVASAGNRLVIILHTQGTITSLVAPSGWTLVRDGTTDGAWIWEKISDGTETGHTFSWAETRTADAYMWELSPSVRQTTSGGIDQNPSDGVSFITSLPTGTGSGITNDATGSYALAWWAHLGGGGSIVSISNGFAYETDTPTRLRVGYKALGSIGLNISTLTWSVARRCTAGLLIYREPAVKEATVSQVCNDEWAIIGIYVPSASPLWRGYNSAGGAGNTGFTFTGYHSGANYAQVRPVVGWTVSSIDYSAGMPSSIASLTIAAGGVTATPVMAARFTYS